MLAALYPTRGKNEKDEIASLGVVFVYIRLRGMRKVSGMGEDIQSIARAVKRTVSGG